MGMNGSDDSPTWSLAFGDPPPPPRTARGTEVTLADGHVWRLPPLNFHDRQVHKEVLDRALGDVNWTRAEAAATLTELVTLALQRNYPGIPRAEVEQRLDLEAACACFKVLWVQEGAQVRDMLHHLGLAPPPSPSPSDPPIGNASTPG